MKKPKVLVLGHGRHGKDSLGNALYNHYGLKFRGSSEVAAAEVIYPMMKNFYDSPEEAFDRRHENRELWAACIRDYNRNDKTKLARLVCEDGHGYTGLRDIAEVEACINEGIFTHIIWVTRYDIPEDDPTLTFSYDDLKEMIYKRQLNGLRTPKIRRIINMHQSYLDEFVSDGHLDEFLYETNIYSDDIYERTENEVG